MVKLDVVRTLNTALVQSQPLVAVFFGGASGIGHHTLLALATAAAGGGKGFRAYVVARRAEAADAVISECRGIYPQGQYRFVKAEDLSLIQCVDRACAEVIASEEKEGQDPRIDYLMMSHGGRIFLPRKDTKEGIDVTMSLLYYSRMRIIIKLLPLLSRSTLPATAVSVYAAGLEAKLYPEDLSLRDPARYSYSQARSHMIYMHTLFMETVAEQHREKLRLISIFPGLVVGPGYHSPEYPLWLRRLFHWIIIPLFGRLIFVPPKESGERMLSLASPRYPPRPVEKSENRGDVVVGTDGQPGSGVYSLTWTGENNLKAKAYEKFNKDEMRKRVWAHTMRAFEVIEGGNVFTE